MEINNPRQRNGTNSQNYKEKCSTYCWRKRSIVERILIIVLLLNCFITVSLAIRLTLIYRASSKICMTPGCVKASAQILEYVDSNVDPCDNFFLFACENFLRTTTEDLRDAGIVSLSKKVEKQIEILIQEPILPEESKLFIAQKKLYQTCVNINKIEEDGLGEIKELINKLGGWPVIDPNNWAEKFFNWKETMYKLREFGYDYEMFIGIGIHRYNVDTNNHILRISEPRLPKKIEEKHRKDYENFMVNVAVKFGAPKARAPHDLRKVLIFRQELRKIITKFKNLRLETGDKMKPTTIFQVQRNSYTIPWLEYINNMTYPVVRVTSEERVIFYGPGYFDVLENLIRGTSKRILANYIIWTVIEDCIISLPKELREIKENFTNLVEGKEDQKSRSEKCIKEARGRLPIFEEAAYIRKYLYEEKRTAVRKMVENIIDRFQNLLRSVEWMDKDSKRLSIEKIKNVTTIVGCPDTFLEPGKLEELLNIDKLDIGAQNYLKMIANVSVYLTNVRFKMLRQSVNVTDDLDYYNIISSVNAYYGGDNTVVLPAGLLQGIFYQQHRPKYLNYGALGSVIGYEIAHGLADRGDDNALLLKPIDRWSANVREVFDNKIECLIKEYDNFSLPETKVIFNANSTVIENLSDLGARVSYNAYRHRTSKHGREQILPGLKYTPNQLFWISAAIHYCYQLKAEQIEKVADDSYALSMFRVNGQLRNNRHFAEDFNCPVNSKMNPAEKCEIW